MDNIISISAFKVFYLIKRYSNSKGQNSNIIIPLRNSQLYPRTQNHCFVIADSQLMKGLSAVEKVVRSLVGQKSVKTCAYMSQLI